MFVCDENCCNDKSQTSKATDNYMTPYSAWESISRYIDRSAVIWDPFYGNGDSKVHFEKLGYRNIIHKNECFFKSSYPEADIIVSNPPFSILQPVLKKLREINKPFILLLHNRTMSTQYFQTIFGDVLDQFTFLIPAKRINFVSTENANQSNCSFDCFYYCYKMNFQKQIIFLKNEN